MVRSFAQCERLAVEEAVLARQLPEFCFLNGLDETCVLGNVNPHSFRNTYTLKIAVPEDFPYIQPDIYVLHPYVLPMFGGIGRLNDLGNSHAYHVVDNGPGNCVRICHALEWDAARSLCDVAFRGITWLYCYEKHLRTGRTIEEILEKFRKLLDGDSNESLFSEFR